MGKSIVNAHSFKMDLSLSPLTPDSCWIQHLLGIYGNECHSPSHTHSRTRAQKPRHRHAHTDMHGNVGTLA